MPAHGSCTPLFVDGLALEPNGRIDEDRLEGELGGTEQWRVDAEHGGHDLDELAVRGEGAFGEARLDGGGEVRVQPGEAPAEHDTRRVERVDETAESDPEP